MKLNLEKISKPYVIIHDGNIVPLMLYVYELNDKGMNVKFLKKEELKTGDTAIVDQEPIKKYIEKNFSFKILYTGTNIKIFAITGLNQ